MSVGPHTSRWIRANPEYHPFIEWLMGYVKEEWTTIDLKRDCPLYNADTTSRMLRKLWTFNIIVRVKRITIPDMDFNNLHSVWRLNTEKLDQIKSAMED